MAAPKRSRTRKKAVPTQSVEGTKKVWVTPFKNAEEVESEEIEVHVFETEPAYVRVAAGQTINLGDFESLRVDVAVTMPCYAEQVGDTQKECAEWVAARLGAEVDQYLGEED